MSGKAEKGLIVIEFLGWVDQKEAKKLLMSLGLELVRWRASRLVRVKVPIGDEDAWVGRMNGDHASFVKKAYRVYTYSKPKGRA